MCLISETIHSESLKQCLAYSKHSSSTVCDYLLCHTSISRKCLETHLKRMYFYYNCSIGEHTSHFFLNTSPGQTINSTEVWLIRRERPALPTADLPMFFCWSIQGCFTETCSAVNHFPLLMDVGRNLLGGTYWQFIAQQSNPQGTQWHWGLAAMFGVNGSFDFFFLCSAMFWGMWSYHGCSNQCNICNI